MLNGKKINGEVIATIVVLCVVAYVIGPGVLAFIRLINHAYVRVWNGGDLIVDYTPPGAEQANNH